MDYSGDFTIQFWSQPTNPQPSFDSIPYSDINTGVPGGVQIVLDLDSPGDDDFRAAYADPNASPVPLSVIFGTIPGAGWHFYRFSRSLDTATVAWCIDGVLQGTGAIVSTFDMTSDQTPNIGKSSFEGVAYFAGGMDDVRIFRRALPCQ